ncbi:MAG: 2-succinyl-5-enolpyruvyl-6-hydroxy-3-cyclohexene-1-carboxylic-acid synthase [Magnetospirillum sp.]|nr:2-succinyl-5-enolpyruvyl-6-hydroxy-3-cyclohexene-1-carboxylic-acid synthase [Magnetospirillum sp.]
MTGGADTNFRWAWTLLDALAARGLRRAVLSPGSRSTPLALAALRHPGIDARVVLDERSAAFFALGMAKAEGVPVAVIATSGSAVANWYPAVVEADMARVPLLLLSADRPPELQDCGANQTMSQVALFGDHVRAFHQLPPADDSRAWLPGLAARLLMRALGPLPGPVHVNIPLREPLVPSAPVPPDSEPPPIRLTGALAPSAGTVTTLASELSGRRGIILCGPDNLGDGFRAAVAALAVRLGVPVLADALSGLRFSGSGPELILAHPESTLRDAPKAEWVLRFGGMPISRAAADYLTRCRGRPQIVVTGHGRPADPVGTATHLAEVDPGLLCDALTGLTPAPSAWSADWLARDCGVATLAAQACEGEAPFEGSVLRTLAAALPEDTALFLGNSLTVRAADWFAGRGQRRLGLFGNRGVSGIDGNLSTAFGIAAMRGPTVAVVGDLTFLHDVGGLALARTADMVILVLDNGGGGIFDHLAQAELPEFEAGWLTPQRVEMEAIARGYHLDYVVAETVGAAAAAVLAGLESGQTLVVRMPVDRTLSTTRIRSFLAACKQGA